MSLLARSIANSLLDDNSQYDAKPPRPELDSINPPNNAVSDDVDRKEGGEIQEVIDNNYDDHQEDYDEKYNDDDDDDDCDGDNEGRGVKEDLSEFTETLTRRFWGVASFLAPPPPPPPLPPSVRMKCDGNVVSQSLIEEVEEEESGRSYDNGDHFDDGELRNQSLRKDGVIEDDLGRSYSDGDDFDEETLLHQSVPKVGVVSEVEEDDLRRSYDNSDYFDEEEEVEDAVGVTEEALAFAHNIAHHPETWLDFPVEEDEEGFEDFRISDSQYKHALAIVRCVPTLAALRSELCPAHMSDGYFWMVYFVLLHSRLCKSDADQLSSAELVRARTTWREELKRAKAETDWFGRSAFSLQESTLSPREDCDPDLLVDSNTRDINLNTYNDESRTHHAVTYDETEKQIVQCDEARSVDTPSGKSERELLTFQSAQIVEDDDSDDDWLQDTADLDGYSTMGIVVNEEDVSFSDLEEDSDWTVPLRSK